MSGKELEIQILALCKKFQEERELDVPSEPGIEFLVCFILSKVWDALKSDIT